MRTKNYVIHIDGKAITIEVEVTSEGAIMVPLFVEAKLLPNGNEVIFTPDEITFLEDINNLKPGIIQDDIMTPIIDSLLRTVNNHISLYGRILDSDKYLLISEQVIVVAALVRWREGEILSFEEKCHIFSNLFNVLAHQRN